MADDQKLGRTVKLQPVFIILSAVIGILIGQVAFFSDNCGGLIEPFLMILIFFIFLKVDISDIGRSFKNVKFSGMSILINFVWTPIFAVLLGMLFLGDSMDLQIGLLMLLVTPCTDWYLVFTAISKGNVPLSTAILPLNLVLQIILLPMYLLIFLGTETSFEMGSILSSILIVLLVPFVTANIVKFVISRIGKTEMMNSVIDKNGDNLQLSFLCLAVVMMFASQGEMLMNEPQVLVQMLIPLAVFFIVNFAIGRIIGRLMRFSFDDTTSLTFTTLARNSPLALAIAIAAFPDAPLIALVLIVGPLVELPVLSLVSAVILRMRDKQTVPSG